MLISDLISSSLPSAHQSARTKAGRSSRSGSCLPHSLTHAGCPEILVGDQMASLYVALMGKAFLHSHHGMMLSTPPSDLPGTPLSLETFRGDGGHCPWLD